jgi:Holliday junction resolvase
MPNGKKINSRAKGGRGERELAKFLSTAGFPAYRSQQYKGSQDSADVICTGLPRLFFECKRVERGNLYSWLKQAQADSGEKIPVVAHRRSNEEWVAVLSLSDFLSLVS